MRTLPDPHTATQRQLIEGLTEIVEAEGPIVARRAYELYVRASGGQRVGRSVRQTLNKAVAAAVRTRTLAQLDRGAPGQVDKTLYMPSSPPVVVRVRGERDLEDIPASEVAALARGLLRDSPRLSDEALVRELLNLYERIRLTANASKFLEGCIADART